MGVASLILGMVAVCVCWLPAVGWAGVALAVLACVLGVLCTAGLWRAMGSIGYGIAGSLLGAFGLAWGLASQIKHASPALDGLMPGFGPVAAWIAVGAGATIAAVGSILARTRLRPAAIVLAIAAAIGAGLAGAAAMTAADRAATGGAQAQDENDGPR